MRILTAAIVLAIALAYTAPATAMPQDPQLEVGASRPAQELGVSLAAAAINIVYFPVRFAITAVSAHVGGLTAWLSGGDPQSAHAVWNATQGQAFITPRILEGRESLRFGESAARRY